MVSNLSESTGQAATIKNALKRVATVAPHAALERICLVLSECRFRPAAEGEELSDHANVGAAAEVRIQDRGVSTLIQLRFEAPSPLETEGEEVATVVAVFRVTYTLDQTDLPAADVEYFGKINGIFNAWPYWREYLQGTLQRMGLPQLTLPLLSAAGAVELAGLLNDAAPEDDLGESQAG